jgi:hypothetical protein
MEMSKREKMRRKPKVAGPLVGAATSPPFEVSVRTAYLGSAIAAILPFVPTAHVFLSQYLGTPSCDMNLQFRHFIEFAVRSVRTGEMPLWNPFIFCGTPFLPSTSATLFYPPNWLFLFALPQPVSINLCILMHVVMFVVACAHYACARGSSNVAALFAGVTAALCIAMPARLYAGHFTIVCTLAWLPVLFLLQERLFTRGARYVLPMGVASALMLLAGHLQYAYYCALLLGVGMAAYAVTGADKPRGKWLLRQIGLHAMAGAIAFALAAIEILPALDVVRFSARGGVKDANWLRFFSMPFENLVTLIAPGVFGSRLEYWGRWYWWEVCYYFGVAGLAFCAVALVAQARTRRVNHLSVLLIATVLLACAGYIPGFAKLVSLIPGWTVFRGHAKMLGPGTVFAVLLSAQGLDLVRADLRAPSRRVAQVAFGLIAGIALIGFFSLGDAFWQRFLSSPSRIVEMMHPYDPTKPVVIAAANGAARLAFGLALVWSVAGFVLCTLGSSFTSRAWHSMLGALVLMDLCAFALPVTSATFKPETGKLARPVTDFLAAKRGVVRAEVPGIAHSNHGMSDRIEGVGGHDINVTRYFDTFICAYRKEKRAEPQLNLRIDHDSPLLDAANLGAMALRSNKPIVDSPELVRETTIGDVAILKRITSLPRAYVVGHAQWVRDDEDAILAALIKGVDFQEEVLLAGATEAYPGENFGAAEAQVEYRGLHEVRVMAPRAGWLVLADAYYPRWHATVAGKPARIYRANGAFRAVRVNTGDEAVFRYSNPAFVIGAWLSGAAVLITLAWTGYRASRGNQRFARSSFSAS